MTTTSPVKQIEALNQRLEKARQIVAEGKVHPIVGMENHFTVEGGKGFYLVNGHCSCPDAKNREGLHRGFCKHKLAVELYKETQVQETKEDLESKIDDLYK
jgi:hypothetical protein